MFVCAPLLIGCIGTTIRQDKFQSTNHKYHEMKPINIDPIGTSVGKQFHRGKLILKPPHEEVHRRPTPLEVY